MKKGDFKVMLSKVATKMMDLTTSKGEEYSRDDDQFANFKRQAEEAGVSKFVVWLIFFNKHIDAVKYFVKHGHTLSESIVDRIDDAILYLMLLRGMIIEDGSPSGGVDVGISPGSIVWTGVDHGKGDVGISVPTYQYVKERRINAGDRRKYRIGSKMMEDTVFNRRDGDFGRRAGDKQEGVSLTFDESAGAVGAAIPPESLG